MLAAMSTSAPPARATAPSGPARPAAPAPGDVAAPLADVLALLVVLLASVVVVATAAEVLDLRPLASRGGSLLALLVALVPVGLLAAHLVRGRRARPPAASRRSRTGRMLLVAAPALLLVAVLLWSFTLPTADRVAWFVNGDHVRHLVLVADERARGALDYARRDYPRAWHTTVTLGWSVTGPSGPRADLVGLVSLMSALCWLLYAALTLATSSLTAALAHRVGVRALPAAVAAALAGAATLWPGFLGSYQTLGFEGTFTAAVVLAVALREVLVRPSSVTASVTTWAGVLVTAHTWQLLLPVSGLLALAATWARVRWAVPEERRRRVVESVGLAAVAGAASLPALTAVVGKVGVGHAAVGDVEAPVPLWLLALGLVAAGVLAVSRRRDRDLILVLALSVLPALTAVGLAVRLGIPVTRYYPAKLLWHTTVLGLSSVAVLGAIAWVRAGSATLRGVVVRGLLGVVAVSCAVGGALGPRGAFTGVWPTVDAATVLRLLATPGAERAQVVWSNGRLVTDDATRIMLDGYRAEASRRDTVQHSPSVEEECALLRAAARPAVLSDRPEEEVRARYACVPGLEVVRAPAG
jgi:hypothetical protein